VLAPPEASIAATAPPRQRHLGINLSLAPGVDVDLDYGLFHGFIAGSLVMPAATDGGLYGFSTGLGLGIPVAPHNPRLRLDVFAHFNVMHFGSTCFNCGSMASQMTYGFGLGLGLHYTWDNGLTLGFTTPVLGYSVTPGTGGSDSYGGARVANYYLSSAIGMPLGFIGYRF
jgi:hypothetical protein